MKVLVNAASANMGGAVTYLGQFLRFLPRQAPRHRWIVYAPEATVRTLQAEPQADSVELHAYPHARTGGGRRMLFDQQEIPALARRHGADVLFSSTGYGTLASPVPQILLVRNTLPFEAPAVVPRGRLAWTLRRWWSLASVRAAQVVVFPSAAMRDLVMRHPAARGKEGVVIPYGFDPQGLFVAGAPVPPVVRQMRAWREAGELVLLYVSSYATHKNFETLVEATARLRAAGRAVRVVTTLERERTGEQPAFDALMARVAALGVGDVFVSAGHLSHGALQHLYGQADGFVFPSLTESFGHPMVEAMAASLPIVAADTPVNREICGDCADFFRATDAADCAAAVERLMSRAPHAERQAARSRARAASFSWTEYAVHFNALVDRLGARTRRQRR